MLKTLIFSIKTRGLVRRNTISPGRIACLRVRRLPSGQEIKQGNGNTGSTLPGVEPRTGCSSHQLTQRTHCAFHLVGSRPVLAISQYLSQVLSTRITFIHSSCPHLGSLLSFVASKNVHFGFQLHYCSISQVDASASWSAFPDVLKKETIRCPEVFGRDPLSVVLKRQRYHAHFCHRQLVYR